MVQPDLPSEMPEPPEPGTTTLEHLRQFDNASWNRMLDQYFDSVLRWCREAKLDEHTAADIAQEVFVSALGSLHRYEKSKTSSFPGWLRRMTQRRIADFYRRKTDIALGGTEAKNMFAELTTIRQSLDTDAANSPISNARLLAAVALAQTEFESTTWRAFWMVTVEERSAVDVALDLGITRNAVYVAKSRVIKRLRIVLDDESTNMSSPSSAND